MARSPGLRVALVSSSYHPYPGGVEEHTRNIARELRTAGHDVVVWTVDRGEGLGVQLLDGIEVRYLRSPLPSLSLTGVADFGRRFPEAWRSWLAALHEFKPDILHVQCFGPNGLYATALHLTAGTPLVISSHGETFADESDVFSQSRLLRAGLRTGLRRAAAVTGCSTVVLEDLRARFGLRGGVVVPNGVDLNEAASSDLERSSQQTSSTVLAVGRLVRVKGFDLLMRAFSHADLPEHVRLIIGGSGPELPHLRRLANELGLDDRCEFPGRLDRVDVIRLIRDSALVVVPSRAEAFGIVVLEGWRGGAPVLATSRGGPSTFVTDGVDAVLADPEDIDAFAAALQRILGDASLRRDLVAGGARSVLGYTWQQSAASYEKIYRGIAETQSDGRAQSDTPPDPFLGGVTPQ